MRGNSQACGQSIGRRPEGSGRPRTLQLPRAQRRSVSRPFPTLLLPLLFLAAALFSAPVTARATLLEPLTLHDLAGRADVVLHGRVQSVRTLSHGPARMPVTVAQIAVLEILAGDLPPRRHVTVTQPGGRAGGVVLDYAGRPQFATGSEVILFLARRGPGQFIIVGLAQGKYDVAADDGHGRRRLSRDLHGAAFAIPATEMRPEDLADLRRRIRGLPRDLAGAPR